MARPDANARDAATRCDSCEKQIAARYGVRTAGGTIFWSGGCRECATEIAHDTGGIVVRLG